MALPAWLAALPKMGADIYNGIAERRHAIKVMDHEQRKETRLLKHKLKQAKLEARIAYQQRLQEQDHTWEMAAMEMHGRGWKDELVLLIICPPLVLCFTPWANLVEDGFATLGKTPLWYQGLVVTIFLAIYGIRYRQRSQVIKAIKNEGEKVK